MPIAQVVSDTSPISNLALIGRLDLLRRLHGTIIIPPAVHAELVRLRSSQAGAAIHAAIEDGWLRVKQPSGCFTPFTGLHRGELECLALVDEMPETLLLIDEAEGRAVARDRGIAISGAVGVLIAARRRRWLPSLKTELLSLRSQARFYISASLFAQALRAVDEEP